MVLLGGGVGTENNKVFILTPVYNRVQTTLNFVDRLKKQTHKNFQLILIDDGSSDGTSEMVVGKLSKTKVIRGNGSLWWAGSLQQGFEWLKNEKIDSDDCVLIINDDTIFDERFLVNGLNLLKENSKSLLIAECFILETKELFDRGVFFDDKKSTFRSSEDSSETNCASTRGLFINAFDFIDLVGFHPKLLPHYTSDYEFTIRASRNGYRIFSDPELKVWTSGAPSGINELDKGEFWGSLKTILFSKLYRRNVIYLSIFAVMTCRWYCIPKIIFRIWAQEMNRLFSVLPGPVYGVIRLVILPVFHLVREIGVYVKVIASETINSLKLIFGHKTDIK